MVNKTLIYDVTDPNNKVLEIVSLFYQQVVLEITFISTLLGPVAFCDNWLSINLLFKVIKMSNSSLTSYLEMDTLICNAFPYGFTEIFLWSFFFFFFFSIWFCTFNISSEEEHLWILCLLTLRVVKTLLFTVFLFEVQSAWEQLFKYRIFKDFIIFENFKQRSI